MIKAAIIGASGYTGLELIKILLNHPEFSIAYLATSQGGEDLSSMHPSLDGVLNIDVEKADAKKVAECADIAFLALPHKTAMGFAKELLDRGIKIVDLSADYRLELETYEKHYCPHEDKGHIKDSIYGLPEIYAEDIKKSSLVANPGCYPTASILALLPFLDLIDEAYPVCIDAKSGVSGAGKKCSEKTHYVSINENTFAYNPFTHRHSPEIEEKIKKVSSKDIKVNFVPHLIPATRGMLVSCYFLLKEQTDVKNRLKDFYKNTKFVRIRETAPDIKSISGTNYCDIFVQSNGNSVFVSSSIDNLLRGASSQAVVNANLMCGFEEGLGIPIIAYVP